MFPFDAHPDVEDAKVVGDGKSLNIYDFIIIIHMIKNGDIINTLCKCEDKEDNP
jgi:hypothetical protein